MSLALEPGWIFVIASTSTMVEMMPSDFSDGSLKWHVLLPCSLGTPALRTQLSCCGEAQYPREGREQMSQPILHLRSWSISVPRRVSEETFRWFEPPAQAPDFMEQRQTVPVVSFSNVRPAEPISLKNRLYYVARF